MLKIIGFIWLISFSSAPWAATTSLVNISIVKSNSGSWTLTYQTSQPAARLSFIRNPDNSRTQRWHPKSTDFEIVSIENQEYLLRKDGSAFTEVSLDLTPTYKHLSKDYAPFSPYSGGGSLLYTGRLFACVNACDNDVDQWQLSMQVPESEHMIIRGKVYKNKFSWLDKNDGMNVYAGSQQPIETDNVIAVIDSSLPEKIKRSLSNDIPTLMNYFQQRLGKIEGVKPTLFASYANVKGQSSQGGTLPNQIFMHWNSNNLHNKVEDNTFLNNTIWFFAHEVAHLYQRSGKNNIEIDSHESWIHEGNAEWLAALALLALYPETSEYVNNRIAKYNASCAEGLSEFPLVEAAKKGRFDLYYSCGLLIHQAIDTALQKQGNTDIYQLWAEFRNQPQTDAKKDVASFLALLESHTSAEQTAIISQVVNSTLTAPEKTLSQLVPKK